MPDLLVRLSYNDLNKSKISEINPFLVFNSTFSRFELESLKETVISTLAEYNYKFNKDDQTQFVDFISRINVDKFRSDYRSMKRKYGEFSFITRNNLLYVLKKLFSESSKMTSSRKNVSNINQISHYLLKLNCFEDGANSPKELGEITDPNVVLALLESTFRSEFVNNKSSLSLSDLIRNHELLSRVVKSKEGKEAQKIFESKFNLKIIEFVELAFLLYIFQYARYEGGNFDNKINLQSEGFSEIPETYRKLKVFLDMNCLLDSYELNKSEHIYNFQPFYDTPIEKIDEKEYRIIDLGLFIEKTLRYPFLCFESPYLNDPIIRSKGEHLALRSDVLGDAFEAQVKEYLRKIELESLPTVDDAGNELSDVILSIDEDLFFCEIKSGYVPINKIIKELDKKNILKLLEKVGYNYPGFTEYASLPKEMKKGVLQIMNSINKISNLENTKSLPSELAEKIPNVKEVYGIVIVQELAFSGSFLNYLLYLMNNGKYSESKYKTYVPVIININDLNKIINGHIPFGEAIKKYVNSIASRIGLSFRSFLDEEYGHPIEINDSDYHEFINMIRTKYIS